MKRFVPVLALMLATAAPAQQVLNLRDADIRAFIQDAARVTGRTFIVDQRVTGKVSVVTERPLSRSEYFEVFLSTLRANGLVAVPTGNGAYRIQPIDGAASQPGRVGSQGATRNSFVTEIFRLRSIDAAAVVETIRPLVSREGSVTANAAGNSLVVADYADNVRRIRSVINRLDTDSAATRVIALRNAGAREIATSLQTLTTAGGPRGTVAVSAIDSSNSIALRGDARAVAKFAEIIADLDRRAAAGSEIRVVWLEHADAEKLLPVLQQLVGQSTSITPAVVGIRIADIAGRTGAAGCGVGHQRDRFGRQRWRRPRSRGHRALRRHQRNHHLRLGRCPAHARRGDPSARYPARTGAGRGDHRRNLGHRRAQARYPATCRRSGGRGLHDIFQCHACHHRNCGRRAAEPVERWNHDHDHRQRHHDHDIVGQHQRIDPYPECAERA